MPRISVEPGGLTAAGASQGQAASASSRRRARCRRRRRAPRGRPGGGGGGGPPGGGGGAAMGAWGRGWAGALQALSGVVDATAGNAAAAAHAYTAADTSAIPAN